MTDDERRALEEIAARAWPHREEIRRDGWLLRFSGGGSKRANSAQTLAWSGQDLREAVRLAEADYVARGLQPIFQVVDVSQPPDLDAHLAQRGYAIVDRTILMTKPVEAGPAPHHAVGRHEDSPGDWFSVYLSTITPDRRATAPGIVAGLPRPRAFFVASDGQGPFAVGLGVAEGRYAGIECMATLQGRRQAGGGRAILAELERWAGEQGAEMLWLQVVEANAPARRLYEGLGFRPQGLYWYRVRT